MLSFVLYCFQQQPSAHARPLSEPSINAVAPAVFSPVQASAQHTGVSNSLLSAFTNSSPAMVMSPSSSAAAVSPAAECDSPISHPSVSDEHPVSQGISSSGSTTGVMSGSSCSLDTVFDFLQKLEQRLQRLESKIEGQAVHQGQAVDSLVKESVHQRADLMAINLAIRDIGCPANSASRIANKLAEDSRFKVRIHKNCKCSQSNPPFPSFALFQ